MKTSFILKHKKLRKTSCILKRNEYYINNHVNCHGSPNNISTSRYWCVLILEIRLLVYLSEKGKENCGNLNYQPVILAKKKLNVGNFVRSYQSMMENTRRLQRKLVKQEKRPGLSEVVMVQNVLKSQCKVTRLSNSFIVNVIPMHPGIHDAIYL